ncbi:MAG: hypothetical protein HN337_00040, partial [Deltaproteobacteria bacterium]|nr:hypothetical protein [Deltaproteobacteria bacterium]
MECTLEPKRTDGNACLPDENPCTLDICQHGKCSHPSTKDGLSCNDGDLCTVQDSCFNGTCQGGAQRACDDGNSCTIDACSIKRGCYHEAIGGGIVNACGGCETLKMFPGEHCQVAGEKGICQSGSYVCQPDGTISCVQNAFSSKEECNGFDDNCNGEIDEGFGASTCGIGECEVAVDNCSEGVLKTCIPRDPLPETCVNHKKDDDCNGVVDDIAGLGQDCPVAFGTCIIPGKKRCIGDAEFPICVPFNPKDAEDGDGDGIVNYCDHGDSIASDVEIEVSDTIAHGNGTSTSARLLDTIQTRAMMLPWQDVYDSIVIAPNSPDQAMLLISGMGAESGGIAAMRAKDVGGGGTITFRSCTAPQGLVPSKLISAGDIADIIAISDKNYVIYPKIASQIPSAIVSNMNCELKGEKVVNDVKRFWKEGGKENTCIVDAVADLQKISDSPLVFAGAVTCTSKSQSVWKKNRVLLGVDLLTQQSNGSFLHRFAPAKIDTAEITDVRIAHDRRGGILLSALFSGERFVGRCVTAGDGIDCWNQKVDKPVDKTIYFDTLTASNERIYPTIVSEDGRAFVVNFDLKERSASVIEAGRVRAKDAENVYSLIEFPSQKDRTPIMIVAEDAHLAAASLSYNKQGGLMLRSIRGVKFIPESVADDIYVGEKMELVRPHAMSIVPLKNYGGHDLYVSYDIKKGFKKLGEMGFFYWNANETPV